MRLCVVLPCFFNLKKTDFCDAVRTVASLGYDAVELWGWNFVDPARAKEVLDETGVQLLSICTTETQLTDPARREAFLEGLKSTCDFAASLGVGRILTQVGRDTGTDRALQHRSITDGLRAAVPILEEYGKTLMIEPLNVRVDHPGYYLTSSAEAFALVREVDHPRVKVIYDIYHQQITEGNILPTVTENLALIAHLHGAGHPGRHELQQGENDYGFLIRALDAAGYEGALGLEYRPTTDPVESLRTARALFGALS